jgi:hypothetical protein
MRRGLARCPQSRASPAPATLLLTRSQPVARRASIPTIRGTGLAFLAETVLAVSMLATSASVQTPNHLACRDFRTFFECTVGCGDMIDGCPCLWDNPDDPNGFPKDVDEPCPPGEICCRNAPCSNWDDESDCEVGSITSSTGGDPSCTWDFDLRAGEECEAGNLGGESRVSLGFAGGKLACATGCTFDKSGCYNPRLDARGSRVNIDNDHREHRRQHETERAFRTRASWGLLSRRCGIAFKVSQRRDRPQDRRIATEEVEVVRRGGLHGLVDLAELLPRAVALDAHRAADALVAGRHRGVGGQEMERGSPKHRSRYFRSWFVHPR